MRIRLILIQNDRISDLKSRTNGWQNIQPDARVPIYCALKSLSPANPAFEIFLSQLTYMRWAEIKRVYNPKFL